MGAAISPLHFPPSRSTFYLLNLFALDSRPRFSSCPKNTAGLQKVLLHSREEQKVKNMGKVRAGRMRPKLQPCSLPPGFPRKNNMPAPEKSPVWAKNSFEFSPCCQGISLYSTHPGSGDSETSQCESGLGEDRE